MDIEKAAPGKVLATPNDVCSCGHLKIYHAWLRAEDAPTDSPAVTFGSCDRQGCECSDYSEADPITQSPPITGPDAQLRAITDLAETMRHELWCETLKHPDKDVECNCIRGKLLKLATPGAEAGIGLAALKILLADTQLLLDLERKDTAYLKERLEAAERMVEYTGIWTELSCELWVLFFPDTKPAVDTVAEREDSAGRIQQAVLSLRSRLEAAEADTKRLDWWLQNHYNGRCEGFWDRNEIDAAMLSKAEGAEIVAALQPPVERQWRVNGSSDSATPMRMKDEAAARNYALHWTGPRLSLLTAQYSDDGGITWTDAPQGTQEEA